MFEVYNNNIVNLTRGDSFSSPLFLNAGTKTSPMRYHLKDGRVITSNTELASGSILAKGSLIKAKSKINGFMYSNDVMTTSATMIREISKLAVDSKVTNTSLIKTGSVFNDKIITEDLTISGDQVYLGIMEPNQPFEQAIVKKVYTAKDVNKYGDIVIKITPDDTVCLTPGKYYYQVKAKFVNDDGSFDVNTVVSKTEFLLLD